MKDSEWNVVLFGLLFGGILLLSLLDSRAALDAVTPGSGWDFTGDDRVSLTDVMALLRYDLCWPAHLALSVAPPELRALLEVTEPRPVSGGVELAGLGLWIVLLLACAKLSVALGNRLGRPDAAEAATRAALQRAREAERGGRR